LDAFIGRLNALVQRLNAFFGPFDAFVGRLNAPDHGSVGVAGSSTEFTWRVDCLAALAPRPDAR
jgi:hypothetical protein